MTDLERLKMLCAETEPIQEGGNIPSSRMYTDDELAKWLELYHGDIRQAAREILMRKAENTQIALPGGITVADNSAYWLRLAKQLHVPQSHCALRADDVFTPGRREG